MCSETRKISITALITLIGFLLSALPVPALTISEERDLGNEFIKHARQSYRFFEDPFVDYYLNRLGRKLVFVFPRQQFDFNFYVIENDVYNAFAAPGGHVFVHSGLISAMDSEEELAGILSHEIAHVYCRHLSERIDKSKKLSLATLAGITAGIFLGSGALAIGSAAAGEAAGLAYSRKDERQADQIGIRYLAAANYSPEGLLSMLKKIKDKHWFSELEVPTYLTTHPGTDERIAYIASLLASDRYKPANPQAEDPAGDFAIVRTIIMATCEDVDTALKQMRLRLEQDKDDALAHFGCALALSRKNRHEEAIDHLKKALDKKAPHPRMLTALGIEYVLSGCYDKALNIFEKIPAVLYFDFRKQLFWAEAAEKAGQLGKSIAILEDLVEKKPDYTEAVYSLGMAYGKNNDSENAHYYLGLYYYKIKNLQNAGFHLQKAYELTSDPEKRKTIEEIMPSVNRESRRQQRPDLGNNLRFNNIFGSSQN